MWLYGDEQTTLLWILVLVGLGDLLVLVGPGVADFTHTKSGLASKQRKVGDSPSQPLAVKIYTGSPRLSVAPLMPTSLPDCAASLN